MADPAQRPAAADPEARRNDQPEDASPECAVINLPDAGNEETQNRRYPWFAHNVHFSFASIIRYRLGNLYGAASVGAAIPRPRP